jgi:hypothetical protein
MGQAVEPEIDLPLGEIMFDLLQESNKLGRRSLMRAKAQIDSEG